MEETNYENGGTAIKWKIENFHCLEERSVLYSPYFFVGTTQKIKGRLYLYRSKDFNSFNFIKDECLLAPQNISVSYSSSMSIDDSTVNKNNGVKSSNQIYLVDFDAKNINTFSNIIIFRCCLRIVSDNSLIVNQYKFRSVVEAEHQRFQCTNLPIKTFDPNNTLFKDKNNILLFPTPLACSLTTPFEIKFCAPGTDNALSMDITKTSENINNVFLICKLSIGDKKEKHVFTATHSNEFKKEKADVWRFPTTINFKDLQSKVSRTDVVLYFEFLVSERKSNTWIEEFSEVPISQTKIVYDSYEKSKANLRDDFMCLYIERKFPDLEIIAGGKKFPAHKAVLCARSPVFSAMFENNMLEKERNVVEISDLDPETVDRMLFFMYSEILEDRNWERVTKLYVASDKYQIMTLKDKCASILVEQLSPENACEALHLAYMVCDSDFLNAVQDFSVTHNDKILQSEEWKEFMNSNSKIACQTMHKAWLRSKKL